MTANSVDNATLRFRIGLRDIAPSIWRRIDVPGDYSFWDLHVAIQDAMGWLDYHLHAFRPTETGDTDAWEIGIPTEDEFMAGSKAIAGWTVRLASHFERAGDKMVYMYDFGDGWGS